MCLVRTEPVRFLQILFPNLCIIDYIFLRFSLYLEIVFVPLHRLCSEATAQSNVQSGWVGTHLRKRRLSALCSLAARSLASLNLLSKAKQRVDVRMVCLYAPSLIVYIDDMKKFVICTIAWALRVARLTIGAMRDALSSGTSNRYSTRAFL